MKNKASCPKCSFEFPIEAALVESVRKDVSLDFEKDRRAFEEKQRQRDREHENALEKVRVQSKTDFERQRVQLIADAKKMAEEERSTAFRQQTAEITILQDRLSEFSQKEREFLRERSQLELKSKTLDLEIARGIEAKSMEVIKETEAKLTSTYDLRLKEKELQIEQLAGKLKEMSRAVGVGSQQLQGESLEALLSEEMQSEFPEDLIQDVKKGARGGDYNHVVRTRTGAQAGIIHVEAKNTKDWGGDAWITKAKEDTRQHGADLSVIVSVVLPKEIIAFGMIEGVIVCTPAYAKQAITLLRMNILQVHRQKWVHEGMKDAKHAVYEYFSGKEFRQRFERLVEVQGALRDGLEREKRSAAKSFAQREKLVDSVMENLVGVFGDLQGLIGEKNLPDIPLLALAGGETESIRDD